MDILKIKKAQEEYEQAIILGIEDPKIILALGHAVGALITEALIGNAYAYANYCKEYGSSKNKES